MAAVSLSENPSTVFERTAAVGSNLRGYTSGAESKAGLDGAGDY
jgi:hypothetical protein